MTHTPWTFEPTEGNKSLFVIKDARGHSIFQFVDVTQGSKQVSNVVTCVNACESINPEAVPDMLAACQHAAHSEHHPHCRSRKGPPGSCDCHVGKASAAINRAETP